MQYWQARTVMRELRLFYIIIVQIKPTHKTDRGKEWRIVLCFQTNFGGKKFKCFPSTRETPFARRTQCRTLPFLVYDPPV